MKDKREEDFILLIQKCAGIIISLCRVYYSGHDDINDTRQEIILQLWKSYPGFRSDSSESTWVYRVSINTILNKIRNERKHRAYEISGYVELPELSNQFHNCDDDHVLLHELLNSLAAEDKALIILVLEGYKYSEIGSMTQLSDTYVSTKINRIKKKLALMIKKHNYEN